MSGMKQDQCRDSADIKRKIMKCYKQLYTHKFDNLDKMGQFFEKPKLPPLTHYKRDNFNSPINIK